MYAVAPGKWTAQEKISMGKKVVIEVLNHAAFGNQIEVNEHVAAEDDVKALHERHAGVIGEIQPTEGDTAANGGVDLQLLRRRGGPAVAPPPG